MRKQYIQEILLLTHDMKKYVGETDGTLRLVWSIFSPYGYGFVSYYNGTLFGNHVNSNFGKKHCVHSNLGKLDFNIWLPLLGSNLYSQELMWLVKALASSCFAGTW